MLRYATASPPHLCRHTTEYIYRHTPGWIGLRITPHSLSNTPVDVHVELSWNRIFVGVYWIDRAEQNGRTEQNWRLNCRWFRQNMIAECNSYWQNIVCTGRIWLILAEHDLYWLIVTLTGRICSQSKVFCRSALLCRFNIPCFSNSIAKRMVKRISAYA